MTKSNTILPTEDQPIALNYSQNVAFEKQYYDKFLKPKESIHYHKSLDFSNVGTYAEGAGYNSGATKSALAFRQFHQTRIYVEGSTFQGMYRHGEQKKETTYLISANLPELVNYRIGSEWSNPLSGLGGPLVSTMANLLKSTKTNAEYQKFIPESLYNRFQTVQMWSGSKPLTMSLTIPVIDDGSFTASGYKGIQNGLRTNLAEALEFLGTLCLPNRVARKGMQARDTAENLGFYTPPPSPISVTAYWNRKVNNNWEASGEYTFNNTNNARILIQIGGMLLIDNCIITGINVRYNNTKSLIRHQYTADENNGKPLEYLTPLIAEVTINFSTIEAITASDYSKMLWLRAQTDMGTGELNARKVQSFFGFGPSE